jgi:hypothetical protein
MELSHCKSSLLTFFAEHDSFIIDTCETLGIYDIFPDNWIDDAVFQVLCGYIPEICDFGMWLIVDEDPSLDDDTRSEDYLGGHFPSGTGLYTLVHYA